MVKITFEIEYHTIPGQELRLVGSTKELTEWKNGVSMTYCGNDTWTITLDINTIPFDYKFQVFNTTSNTVDRWEDCANRSFFLCKQADRVYTIEEWDAPQNTKIRSEKARIIKSTIKKSCSMEFEH
ncbi:CBM20 domain-containing protein [Entamoeba marina]